MINTRAGGAGHVAVEHKMNPGHDHQYNSFIARFDILVCEHALPALALVCSRLQPCTYGHVTQV